MNNLNQQLKNISIEDEDDDIDVILLSEIQDQLKKDGYGYYNIIENNTNNDKKYTKVCKSIFDKNICKHGDKCCFAHYPNQLIIKDCGYGSNCIHIYSENNKLKNRNINKICEFIHPQEDKDEYFTRIGLKEFYEETKNKIYNINIEIKKDNYSDDILSKLINNGYKQINISII
jgi:hypothetical protein